MTLTKRTPGLCSTCNNGPLCIQCKSISAPVLFCEEFDDWTPVKLQRPTAAVPAHEYAAPDRAMGLCCNCSNLGSCTLKDSPGGVWHCEEYC